MAEPRASCTPPRRPSARTLASCSHPARRRRRPGVGSRCWPTTCTTSTACTRSPPCCSRRRPRRPSDGRASYRAAVHILVATDADFVLDDITAALAGPTPRSPSAATVATSPRSWQRGHPTSPSSICRSARWAAWRSRCSCGSTRAPALLPHVPVLMLLDRRADLHLAQRSAADGWVIKPLDALTLERAVAGDRSCPPPAPLPEPRPPGRRPGVDDRRGPDGPTDAEEEPVSRRIDVVDRTYGV